MRLVCVLFGLLGLYAYVEAAEFRFGEIENNACILLNMDATFNLTWHDNITGITEVAPLFNLDGALVAPNKSLCGTDKYSAVLTVTLFPSNERLAFKFVIVKGYVEMSVVLDMMPVRHFDEQNETLQFEMEDDGNLDIGVLSTNSFRCLTEQTMIFNRDEPFYMTMSITNLQVQAYNIEEDTFGPAIECPQDEVSTQGPTTQPVPETTPPPPPSPDVPVYVVRNDNMACIVLRGRLKFNIKYLKTDGDTGEVTVAIPESVKVSGSCLPDNSSQTQQISLTFFDTNWVFDIEIEKLTDSLVALDDDVEYRWQKILLSYEIDDHFEDADEPGKKMTVQAEFTGSDFKGSISGSYKCNSEQNVDISDDVSLGVSDLQYDAFSERNDTAFPDTDVNECDADKDDDDEETRIVITVLGSVFGGLALIIFIIGFIWKVRSRKRVNYELLAGVSYDKSLRSDTSMEKRMY